MDNTQFCFHYQKHREKNRATMHIPRKPGEQIEVDWAGNTAKVIDFSTGEIIPYFGGSTRMLISDNLRTGVDHSDWYTPKINKTYHEMAEHYDTAVIPARVRAPKVKTSAEGTVGVISTWITAAIRNEKFFSLAD